MAEGQGTAATVDLADLRIEEPPRRRGVRPLLVLLVLASIAGAFFLGLHFRPAGEGGVLGGAVREVRTETVGRTPRDADRRSGGSFREGGWVEVPSYHPIVVSALVSGRVEDLLVLEGQPVEKDQVVARLWSKERTDTLRLKEAAVAAARARLERLEAGYRTEDVEKARADVDRALEEVRLAEKILARTHELLPTGAASAEDRERHEASVRVAKAALRGAEQELARLEAGFRKEDVAEARAQVGKEEAARDLARSELSYCEVTSPAKGVVFERFVTAGTWVSRDNPRIVSLYDPSDLQVRVDVRQENAARVRIGQDVEVVTDVEPERIYPGVVLRLDPMADLRKNTVQAKIRLAETGPRLHPEMICTVRFVVEEPEEPVPSPGESPALTVPASAVVASGGRTWVFVVRSERVRRVEVRTGRAEGGRVEIEAGLTDGDRVVLSPPGDLEDGEKVREAAR
jgi:RND family efflux transporter MFP subunit